MLADRRLCLDRSLSRLVEEMHPDATYMVVPKGDEVPADLVKRLDLRVWSDGRVMQGPEPVVPVSVVEPEPESKPVVAPLEGIVHPAGAMPEPVRPTDTEVKAYLGVEAEKPRRGASKKSEK